MGSQRLPECLHLGGGARCREGEASSSVVIFAKTPATLTKSSKITFSPSLCNMCDLMVLSDKSRCNQLFSLRLTQSGTGLMQWHMPWVA
jgi:hypothetical protein